MAAGDLRLEVWRRPGAAVFERLVEQIPGPFNFTKRMAGGVGQGDITVPATWDRINNVITRIPGTPSSDVRTLNRVLMEQASGPALVKYEWFNDVTGDESREDFTQIQGAGIESIMADGIVYPWDWDGLDESTSTFPDWIWGGKDVVGPVATSFAPHTFDAWISTGATGTFDIDVDLNGGGFQSATIAPGDTAATVEIAIEGLTNVTAADVQGNGTDESPWRISITAPAGTWTVAIDSSGLSGGRGFTNLDQFGKLMPIGWTQSLVGSTNVPHGILTDFRASLGGGADPTLPAGCDAWVVFLGQEWYFPGVQKRIRVTAGAPFQIPDDYIQLYAQGANADVRLIVRDLFEQEICSIELSLVSNTLTPVPGFSCLIPLGITEVVFRLGHIGTGTPPRIFMACPSMREGLAPTTAGGIMEALMDDAILDHIADGRLVWENLASVGTAYVVPTYSVTLDSDGVAWDEDELTFTAQRGKTYLQVLTDLNHLGYKWTVTAGATGSWNLNLYNPTWVDTDATTLPTPAINIGSGVTGGPIFRSHMTGNVITVEGSQMQFGRSASATSVASIGRREAYQPDRSLMNNQMASLRAAEEVASRLLSGLSVAVTVDPVTGPIPLLDYDVDWQLNVQVPPILQKSAHRLASITVSVGEITQYKLAFSSESFAGVQGVIEGVRRLMLKFEGLERPINEDIPTPTSGGGGAPTLVIAAANSTEYSKMRADFICAGVNDEGTIQQAMDLLTGIGGRILLCEGLFSLSMLGSTTHALTLPVGITLLGMGQFITTLLLEAGSPASANLAVISTFGQNGAIRDLAMDAATIASNPPHLIRTTSEVELSGLYLRNAPQDAISCGSGSAPATISNVYISASQRDGISMTSAGVVRLVSVYVDSAFRYGIYSSQGGGAMVGVAVSGSLESDYYLEGHVGTLDQCSSNGAGTDGFTLDGCRWVIMTGCQAYSAGEHGIRLVDSEDCIISNNVVHSASVSADNTFDNVFLEGDCNRNLIQGNRLLPESVTPTSRYGINISDAACDSNMVTGNLLATVADFGTGDINDVGTGTMIANNLSV